MSGDPSQVIQFLAQNDAACPSCGYSLRGCSQPCCPECGDEISLSLRGESSNVLVTALRYLLWALGARSLAMIAWWIWASINYTLNGALSSLGPRWYLQMGITGLADVGILGICLVTLHRLKFIKRTGKFRGITKLIAWIAILIVGDVVVGIANSLSY